LGWEVGEIFKRKVAKMQSEPKRGNRAGRKWDPKAKNYYTGGALKTNILTQVSKRKGGLERENIFVWRGGKGVMEGEEESPKNWGGGWGSPPGKVHGENGVEQGKKGYGKTGAMLVFLIHRKGKHGRVGEARD